MGAEGSARRELEERIGLWRSYVGGRDAMRQGDVDELEDHLRNEIAELSASGLAPDEAFLVAVKRLGELDDLTREFAREHSDRLWKQLVEPSAAGPDSGARSRMEPAVVIGLAAAAALAFKVPSFLGLRLSDDSDETVGFYMRNMSLFVLPCLFAYFGWKRRFGARQWAFAGIAFATAGTLVNTYPFVNEGQTQILAILHLPIFLWFVVGVGYTGANWRSNAHWMHFVRFTGELFIYFVLIALGGGVLTGFTLMMFQSIGLDAEWLAQDWIVPCGALGAVIVGAWLVEAKQSVIENMAPVLTRLFTPLFTVVLLAFIVTMAWTGSAIDVGRGVLIAFDLLLVLVLGLLLYSVSARDPRARPGYFDVLQLVLVVSALLVDLMALAAISSRITEFGFSANKTAALGENLVLLINLSWSAWLYFRFLRGRGPFAALERWQTAYLPVYAVWAWIVFAAFPLVFDFA